jgi:arylformamidase
MKLFLTPTTCIDTKTGFDLSIPLQNNDKNPTAWYVAAPEIEPVMENGWVGAVKLGGAVNFNNIRFNPHGHTTHTECLGHITEKVHSINQTLSTFFFTAKVITIIPEHIENNGVMDKIITAKQLKDAIGDTTVEALIVRTLPNVNKASAQYSGTNPCYFETIGAQVLIDLNIKHLLIDLPSVDREEDGGKLAFHHLFWQVPEDPNFERTISELLLIGDEVEDGEYILNLQVAAFENDAAPSRPVIFKIESI